MIKGAQKKMIVVKTGDSAIFEEAYFVLRRESAADEADMVKEANKIIESHGGKKKKGGGFAPWVAILWAAFFFCGIITGGGAAALIILL